jgi:hypothetical protein
MTVMLNLSAEIEQLLREKAARVGKTLEAYLEGLSQQEARANHATRSGLLPGTVEQWSAEWRAWADADRNFCSGITLDDSRESIYAGRGE